MSSALLWFLLGLACFLCEMALPHLVLCFFGAGAWAVALLDWLAAPGLAMETGIFLGLSLLLLLALRRLLRNVFLGERRKPGEASPHQHPLCGARGQITRAGAGEGEAAIGGSFWRVRPCDAAATLTEGMTVCVRGADASDATLLLVEPVLQQ